MNSIENAMNAPSAITAAPLEQVLPGAPVSCLFAAAVRAIATQANLAQAARFAAQRQNYYQAFARNVAGVGFTPRDVVPAEGSYGSDRLSTFWAPLPEMPWRPPRRLSSPPGGLHAAG